MSHDPLRPAPSGKCVRCTRPVAGGPDGNLRHLTPEGVLSVQGCQSASFDWPGGRDRDMPRWWKAMA